ncbi:MAG: type IVB secretion system protein IcmH/DotU [Legionellales bacterium]|nr:type IVB secretion system protein IcmH/DotU [Legionellales bacterium]
MSAELQVTGEPFTLPLAIPAPAGYFRSKLFSSNAASNPLVAAASPVLSILERLCVSQALPKVDSMRENLEHELFAFHSRMVNQQYSEDTIVLSYYLLSATIDELLGKNYLRVYGQPTAFKAFTPSNANDLGPESQFFIIITHLKDQGSQYLDLLELAYYCLIAGFEGEQHLRTDGRQILENLMEDLHKVIQHHRVYKPQLLFKTPNPSSKESKNYRPFVMSIMLSLSLLMAMYVGSQRLLDYQAKNVFQHYATMVKHGLLNE